MVKEKLFGRISAFWRALPIWFRVFLILTLLSGVIHIIAVFSKPFAGFFNQYIAAPIRALFSTLVWIIPFSLAEILILLLPAAFIGVIVLGILFAKNNERFKRLVCAVLAVVMFIYISFVFTFATGYRADRLDVRLSLGDREVTKEELYDTAAWLVRETNALSSGLTYAEGGESVMPYSVSEMSAKLGDALDRVADEYGLFFNFPTRAKPVIFSRVMSRAHITGVYTFFTGESNLNVDFPDYTLPNTAAHEFSHQRGISREDEANFVAFLVCDASDDQYIRYSGYINMLEYTMNTLYGYDAEGYFELFEAMAPQVRGEMAAYSRFFDQYRDTELSEVMNQVNDTTLKLNGTEGRVSYNLVVNLTVGYYNTRISQNLEG